MWFMFQHLVEWCSADTYFKDASILQDCINNVQNSFTLLFYTFSVIFLKRFFVLFPGEKKLDELGQ